MNLPKKGVRGKVIMIRTHLPSYTVVLCAYLPYPVWRIISPPLSAHWDVVPVGKITSHPWSTVPQSLGTAPSQMPADC